MSLEFTNPSNRRHVEMKLRVDGRRNEMKEKINPLQNIGGKDGTPLGVLTNIGFSGTIERVTIHVRSCCTCNTFFFFFLMKMASRNEHLEQRDTLILGLFNITK